MSEAVPFAAAVYRKRMAFALVCAHQSAFRKDFMAWLSANWHVWLAFEREANAIWARGRSHYSARTICEVLRHETALRQDAPGEEWKINNCQIPDLARLYALMYPQRADFFETRVNPLSVRAA
jgi:hypothetical protein